MRKGIIAAGVFALASPLVIFGTAGQANAATSCNGTGCNGLIAAQTTCVNDAIVVETAYSHWTDGSRIGTLQLYYSPSCRAAWARGESNWAYGGGATIVDTAGENWGCVIPSSVDAHCNSDMVSDAGITSTAYGYVLNSDGDEYKSQTASY